MNVINRKTLKEHYKKYADAENALDTWYKVCRRAEWKNFNEVKQVYPSADVVRDSCMVFNIVHNQYRLVVRFSFLYKMIQIKWFGTHAAYDKIDVTTI